MKQKEYKIKVHSVSRFIIAMIILLPSSTMLILDNLPQTENRILYTIQFLLVLISSFYISHLIGLGKVKILFTEEGIVHIWEKRFILNREKNIKIPWEIVDNYVFQEDRAFDSIIINLTNKTKYEINRLNILPLKDDFKSLVKDFPKLSNEYKRELISDLKMSTIKEGESIYSSKSFKWVFYFMSAVFLILILTKIISHNSGTTWSSLSVIGSGLLFYGVMTFRQKKK